MIEMEYGERREIPLLLEKNTYKGYEYIILSQGVCPTAYVKVDRPDELWSRNWLCDDLLKDVKCHGGVTYTNNGLHYITEDGEEHRWLDNMGFWFIGWDYAHHGGFYFDRDANRLNKRKYTTKEIIEDCKIAIDSIIKINEVNKK